MSKTNEIVRMICEEAAKSRLSRERDTARQFIKVLSDKVRQEEVLAREPVSEKERERKAEIISQSAHVDRQFKLFCEMYGLPQNHIELDFGVFAATEMHSDLLVLSMS